MTHNFNFGSENWFGHETSFFQILHDQIGKPNLTFLEMGCWKGKSSVWLLENVLTHPTSTLFCVDVWDIHKWNPEAEETQTLWQNVSRQNELDCENIYNIFLHNIRPYKNKCTIIKDYTQNALNKFIQQKLQFDFIYIDADHSTDPLKNDFKLSLQCIKKDGYIFLDDLSWNSVKKAIEELSEELGISFNIADENGVYYKEQN